MTIRPAGSADERVLHSLPEADVFVEPFGEQRGTRRIIVHSKKSLLFVARQKVVTSYPDELILLILDVKGPGFLCDEIARDEDHSYVAASLELDILSFLPAPNFEGKRVLDFGCGSGASTMILNRMLKGAEIYGVELDPELLRIAKARAVHYGLSPEQLVLAPNGNTLPGDLGTFDAVVLSAVWEHLLPIERPVVLKQIWSLLRPGGYIFLNQTPHRFSPIESHTTGLPLINYLPARFARAAALKFSRRQKGDETWETLLRQGIRGGTRREVMEIIRRSCHGVATLVEPIPSSGAKDVIDLWYRDSASARLSVLKRCIWAILKFVKIATSAEIVPSLTLAIRKDF